MAGLAPNRAPTYHYGQVVGYRDQRSSALGVGGTVKRVAAIVVIVATLAGASGSAFAHSEQGHGVNEHSEQGHTVQD